MIDEPIAHHVWVARYRLHADGRPVEDDIEATWRRVARALAAAEPEECDRVEESFLGILRDFRFLPGGRILGGAGTERQVTLFNCFVMGRIEEFLSR